MANARVARAARSNLIAWLALVVLTLASVSFAALTESRGLNLLAVFGAAVIKGQIVAIRFMETQRALPAWNALYRTWIAAIGIVLGVGIYFAGRGT